MSQIAKSQPERYLGKYKIISKLGQGAMGLVYKGFDPSIERYVALKTVSSHILTMDDSSIQSSLARFKQEAKIAGRLNHPNIVSVYEYGEDKNTIFIAMEFVEGRELKQVFQKQPVFDPAATVKLMIPLLEALKHSHDNGVIHRDIKPGNIIVTPTGNIKVTDFGIARIGSSDLTQMGTLLGTPSYMSPEILDDKAIDARTDLFSAGIVFYQCLLGRKPFEGSPQQVMNKIATREHIPPSVLNPKLSPQLDQIVAKALAKDPDQRYPSAAAMIMDLKHLANPAPIQTTPSKNRKKTIVKKGKTDEGVLASYRNDQFTSPSESQDTGRSSTTPMVIAIAFLIMAIIAALYVYYDRFGPGDKPPAVADLTTESDLEPDLKQFPLNPGGENSETKIGTDIAKPPVIITEKIEGGPDTKVDLSPVPDTVPQPLPLVLATLDENAQGLANVRQASGGRITLSMARSALKLKIAFVNRVESYIGVPDAIVNQIMASDRVIRVTQGPADIICTLTQTSADLILSFKNRYIANDQDVSFFVQAKPEGFGEDLATIHRLISKLYAFNTFDLLKRLGPMTGGKTNMVISGSEDNTLFVGNKTDICIYPDQEAYLVLLNINSMNITMLFPHFMNQDNYIRKGKSKCSGSMDIYPPIGTEMIVSFLLKDIELIEKFGYTLSQKNSYYFWDFDQGQAVDFCETMVVQLLNAGKNWSVDNKIVQIKNNEG